MSSAAKEAIEDLDRRLIAEHERDFDLFELLNEQQRRSGILHGSRPICPYLRPYFLESSRYQAIRAAAAHLFGAFNAITQAALGDAALMAELGVTEKEARWARLDPGFENVSITSRLDTFLAGDGFAFLEYNGENPAGVGDQVSLERLFDNVPAVREFISNERVTFPRPMERLLAAVLDAYSRSGGEKAKPMIAIVDWEGVDTAAEFELLADYFRSAGLDAMICDPHELGLSGTRLHARGSEIDIFFKRVIIHEFLERFDETHPLYVALENRDVCMINPFRSKIPHKKSSFAILTDERYERLFTPAQLSAIRAHVPWTRVVRESRTLFRGVEHDLPGLIRRERSSFVIKPNDDYGGHGIVFGWEADESAWDDAISEALDQGHIVQLRVPVEKAAMPYFDENGARMVEQNVDFDPFLFAGDVEGGMVRLGAGSLVNITQGGTETALGIIDDL